MFKELRKLILPEDRRSNGRAASDTQQPTSWYVHTDGNRIRCVGAEPLVIGSMNFVGDDIEKIAQLWVRHGEKSLSLVEGSFCFVCWDSETSEVIIVRDHVGIKTIYLAQQGSNYWISPKLHTIAKFTDRKINQVALRDYLCCAFVPGEQTMFEGIVEVRPGTIRTLKSSKSYWNIEENFDCDDVEPLEIHAKRLRQLLEQVIAEQLPANEDVGCYLSGGLDSSSVTAIAKRLHNREVRCFSIHFGNECPNELEYSRTVAAHCEAIHHLIEITPQDMWNEHAHVMALLDDPIGDPLTVPNFVLGRVAKKYTNVILNGEGGDPCFGGPKNQPMMLESLYQTDSRDAVSAYLASFQKCSTDLHRLLRPSVQLEVADKTSTFEEDLRAHGHYVNKLFLINTKYKGADHILTKVNNITSAFGISGRSPLFDRRVVDLSLSTPPHYKLKGAQEKAILKASVADLLPETILTRPKSGMMVPVQLWYRKYWNTMARQLLLSKDAKCAQYMDQSVIRDWLDYRGDVWSRYGVKLWLLTALELWLQAHAP